MARCLVGLGANLQDRAATLSRAVARLAASAGVKLLACSRWYQTAPVGGPPGQPLYLNGAALLDTSLAPEALLALLEQVERELGRRREVRWGPRAVDLDLLLYDALVLDTPRLTLPHPRMAFRRFVLEPAAEIAADMVHPPIGWTVAELLRHLVAAPPYVAITGPPGAGKTQLAGRLLNEISGPEMAARLIADQPGASSKKSRQGETGSHLGHSGPDRRVLKGSGPAVAGEVPAADLSGRHAAREIQFLAERRLLLDHDAWTDGTLWAIPEFWFDQSLWVISDFWFDQSLAWAAAWLTPEHVATVRTVWLRSRGEVVRPKLLIVLDAAEDGLLTRIGQQPNDEPAWDAGRLRLLRDELARLARRPGQGPVLWLPAGNDDLALAEASAAMTAMQSAVSLAD